MRCIQKNHFHQIQSPETAWSIFGSGCHEAYDEGAAQLRMQNEGGIPLTKKQNAAIDVQHKTHCMIRSMVLHLWHDLPCITVDQPLFETC